MMKEVAEEVSLFKFPREGEIIEGKIVGKGRSAVYLDLGIFGTGIIYGKEYLIARELLRNCKDGEKIFAKITAIENEDGYIELSASKAGQKFAWDSVKEKKESGEFIKVKIVGANKGGLLTKVMNLQAFLPVSQLSSENYPRVEGGDSIKILRELQKFIGTEMSVNILDFNQEEEKLILSEKIREIKKAREALKNYKVGDIVEGKITGVADFGVFVSFGKEEIEGLIHISEMAWQTVKDPSEIIGDREVVEAKIIEINDDRVFLSLRALKDNPWEGVEGRYKEGDVVKGKVVKAATFGVFVVLDNKDESKDKIQGLCHVSEFGSYEEMTDKLREGEEYEFEIVSFEPKEYRMILKPKK